MRDDFVIKDTFSGHFWSEEGWFTSPVEAKVFHHPLDAVQTARAVKQYEVKGLVEVIQLADESRPVTVWAT